MDQVFLHVLHFITLYMYIIQVYYMYMFYYSRAQATFQR